MKETIEKALKLWYVPLILGIVFSLAGIVALLTPVATFITFSIIIAIGFILSGIVEAVFAVKNRKWTKGWGWYLFGALLSIVAGFILIANPGLTLLLFSLYVGFWILFRSITEIGVALDLKQKGIKQWGWMLFLSIIGVMLSIILIWNPLITGFTVGLWIGLGFITLGIFHIFVSIRLQKLKDRLEDIEDFIELD